MLRLAAGAMAAAPSVFMKAPALCPDLTEGAADSIQPVMDKAEAAYTGH